MARETIRRIDTVVLDDFAPDLTLILDLAVEEGLQRIGTRAHAENRFEKFGPDFHERLRQAFLDIASREPGRCRLIDAARAGDRGGGDLAAVAAVSSYKPDGQARPQRTR